MTILPRGKYNGKATLKLLSCAKTVLEAVQSCILANVPEESRCSNDEIIKQISVYTDFFTVFDSIFSNSRTTVGFLSEAKEEETHKGISMGLKMWRDLGMSVTPKLHVLEDHLLSQLSLFKGLGDCSEDFVEQVHQVGIR